MTLERSAKRRDFLVLVFISKFVGTRETEFNLHRIGLEQKLDHRFIALGLFGTVICLVELPAWSSEKEPIMADVTSCENILPSG